jgi:cytochrome P450
VPRSPATVDELNDRFNQFDPAYVQNVIAPHLRVRIYQGERLSLPLIDPSLSKQNAMPDGLWGLISETWKPCPEDGVVLFLQGLEKRGPDNRRKRIYMSAMTPDLYGPMYADKVRRLFDKLLHVRNGDRPLMRPYLEAYFELYWDLHLGVCADAIPAEVRRFAESLNIVLAYRDPTLQIVYENYMRVNSLLPVVREWIGRCLADLVNGKMEHPERTFAHYWLTNGGDGDYFRRKDIVAECVHDFFAFNQFGTTIYNIMLKLSANAGDPACKASFRETMHRNGGRTDGPAFAPLARFVMELLRAITPNAGSLSRLEEVGTRHEDRQVFLLIPHAATSFDPLHWKNPDEFDPDRYKTIPTSDQIDEAKCEQIGFARCPFDKAIFEVKDGRNVGLANSGFGTVYPVVDGEPLPVCEQAGFAPFGFGYRRCPGEQFTIKVFEDFLRKVWADKIDFQKLDDPDPEQVPIGPGHVAPDDLGFSCSA